jgi:hypothetical protein
VLFDGSRAQLFVVCERLELQHQGVVPTPLDEGRVEQVPVPNDGLDRFG